MLYALLLDGCEPPLYVENATATFSQVSRTVSLTCIKGHRFHTGQQQQQLQQQLLRLLLLLLHRFPTGQSSYTAECKQDGSWDLIDHCEGINQRLILGSVRFKDTLGHTLTSVFSVVTAFLCFLPRHTNFEKILLYVVVVDLVVSRSLLCGVRLPVHDLVR